MRGCISMQHDARIFCACFLDSSFFGCRSISYPEANDDPSKNNKVIFQQDAVDCAKAYPNVELGARIK